MTALQARPIRRRRRHLTLRIISAAILAVLINYFITPSESLSNPLFPTFVRFFAGGLLCLRIAAFVRWRQSDFDRLFPWFLIITFWFCLSNRLGNPGGLLILFIFIGSSFLIVSGLTHSGRCEGGEPLPLALTFVVFFWVGALAVQAALYFVLEESIDLHSIFYPWSEARLFGVLDLVRLTGVHIEPGTYANWLYGLVLLRGLISRKLFDTLSLVAVLSLLTVFSVWGAIAAAVYLFSFFLQKLFAGGKRGHLVAVGIIVTFLICGYFLYQAFATQLDQFWTYLTLRAQLNDESGAAKVQAYDGFVRIFHKAIILGVPLTEDFCSGCLSPQDAGIMLNLVVRGGLPLTLALFGFVAFGFVRAYGFAGALLVFPLAVSKFFYYEPLFWMIFAAAVLQVPALSFSGTARANKPDAAKVVR